MNIVLITTGSRPEMLNQTVNSLIANAAHPQDHHITLILDGVGTVYFRINDYPPAVLINIRDQSGASRARNVGASSIPKYRRQSHVMFIDDDVYLCPKWDEALQHVSNFFEPAHPAMISGHAHPYNHTIIRESSNHLTTNVISTVHMVMPWPVWDDVGYFIEPGGPGGSEDVDYCTRATAKGYGLVITKPHCVIHCGLTNSSGKPIVGYDLMVKQNKELVEHYQIRGLVQT